MSKGIKLTPKQSNNLKQSQSEQQNNPQVENSNQLTLAPEILRALEAVSKKRAEKSPYMKLELNQTYTLLFNPAKMKVEQKTFNGQSSERVSHSVTDLDNREAGEKSLSLTYKQSAPIEEIISKGYTVMQVTKMGEGFELSYRIDPIE